MQEEMAFPVAANQELGQPVGGVPFDAFGLDAVQKVGIVVGGGHRDQGRFGRHADRQPVVRRRHLGRGDEVVEHPGRDRPFGPDAEDHHGVGALGPELPRGARVEGLIAAEDEFVVGRRPVDLAVFPLDLDEGFGDGLRRLQAVEIGARGDAHVVVGLRIAWLDRESERRRARRRRASGRRRRPAARVSHRPASPVRFPLPRREVRALRANRRRRRPSAAQRRRKPPRIVVFSSFRLIFKHYGT